MLYRDPLVAFWTGPWNPATVQTWATDMATRWNMEGVGKWLARSRSDASLVGRGGFTRFDLHGESVLELGWVVRDALTDRGYATEIGRAALDWAAIHEPRTPIVAFTEVHNQASQAVMRRLGMRPAGMIRRTGLVEGRPGLHPDAPFALYRLEHDDRLMLGFIASLEGAFMLARAMRNPEPLHAAGRVMRLAAEAELDNGVLNEDRGEIVRVLEEAPPWQADRRSEARRRS